MGYSLPVFRPYTGQKTAAAGQKRETCKNFLLTLSFSWKSMYNKRDKEAEA
jgi:hypothetical protein